MKNYIQLTTSYNGPIYINKDKIIDIYRINNDTIITCIGRTIVVSDTLDEVFSKLNYDC